MHRLRGFEENWYEASKTDGRCLEPVYRRSKSLSVRRVISRNPFCAVLSRSSLPKKGRRNEKPTKTMQLFNRARFLPFPLSFSSFIPLLFLYFQCSPGDRYPVSLGIVSEPVVKGLRYRLARKFNKPVEARWTTCLNRVDWSESLSLSLSFSLSLCPFTDRMSLQLAISLVVARDSFVVSFHARVMHRKWECLCNFSM